MMQINVIFREENELIKLSNVPANDILNVSFRDMQSIGTNDFNELKNKPSINSIVLQGALSAEDLGLGRVYYDSKENWDRQLQLIAECGAIYIYSDYTFIEDEAGNRTEIAGIKIGDGTSYLIDMPFISDAATYLITTHIANTGMHVSRAEKEFWNNKVSAYINHEVDEELVLSKTSYELNGEIIEA